MVSSLVAHISSNSHWHSVPRAQGFMDGMCECTAEHSTHVSAVALQCPPAQLPTASPGEASLLPPLLTAIPAGIYLQFLMKGSTVVLLTVPGLRGDEKRSPVNWDPSSLGDVFFSAVWEAQKSQAVKELKGAV